MLGSKVVRFIPHRTSTVADVMFEIASKMTRANPGFRYQCPSADIDNLMAGILPDEIRIFVDDPHPKSGPQPDAHFIREYRSSVFRDVIVADVFHAVSPPGEDGRRFSDYTLIGVAGSGIAPISGAGHRSHEEPTPATD